MAQGSRNVKGCSRAMIVLLFSMSIILLNIACLVTAATNETTGVTADKTSVTAATTHHETTETPATSTSTETTVTAAITTHETTSKTTEEPTTSSTEETTTTAEPTTTTPPPPVKHSILEVLADLGLFRLLKLVFQANLDQLLEDAGNYTIFAPTDEAIDDFVKHNAHLNFDDAELVKLLVLNHAIAGAVYNGSELAVQKGPLTSAASGSLFINTMKSKTSCLKSYVECKEDPDEKYIINGRSFEDILANHTATNGIVHIIDGVIFPIGSTTAGSFVDNNPEWTSLTRFFVDHTSATTVDVFTNAGKVNTYFLPINQAWTALPFDLVQKLLEDPKLLSNAILLHVVPATTGNNGQPLFSPAIANGTTLAAANGKNLTVTISTDGVRVNNARVVWPDVTVKNGVIHLIDAIIQGK